MQEEQKNTMTYLQIKTIENALQYVNTQVNDKLTFYAGKLIKKLKRHLEDYSEKIGDIDITNCSIDEKNNIIKDEKGTMSFTQEKLKKRNKEVAELNKKEIEIDFTSCVCPDNSRAIKLPIAIVNELNGILFNLTEEDYSTGEAKK